MQQRPLIGRGRNQRTNNKNKQLYKTSILRPGGVYTLRKQLRQMQVLFICDTATTAGQQQKKPKHGFGFYAVSPAD